MIRGNWKTSIKTRMKWEKDIGQVEKLLTEAGKFQGRLGEGADDFFGGIALKHSDPGTHCQSTQLRQDETG